MEPISESQSMSGRPREEPDIVERSALEIVRRNKLQGVSLETLSESYPVAVTTLHRKLRSWLDAGRFELSDTWADRPTAWVADINEELGEALARKTNIWRARVVNISGVESANSDDYLEAPDSPEAQAAYEAGDWLHMALGEVAAKLLLDKLRPNMTIGLASGRGVGFTIKRLDQLAEERTAWIRRYQNVEIFSLSGGAHVGSWSIPIDQSLDADDAVFRLGKILQVSPLNLRYKGSWLLHREGVPEHPGYQDMHLDLAIVGIGPLNTQHYFFRPLGEMQLESMGHALECIQTFHDRDPELRFRIAEICHRLFPVGLDPLPDELSVALEELNQSLSIVSEPNLRRAEEVIMVAGGTQKLRALHHLLIGDCPQAPIELDRLTLITDAVTAQAIVDHE